MAPLVTAYLDAGSGSMLVSAVAAGAAGVGVAAKVGWRRLKRAAGRGGSSGADSGAEPRETPAAET